MKKTLGILLISALGGVIAVGLYKGFFEKPQTTRIIHETNTPVIRASNSPAAAMETDFTLAAEKTVNAVVHIKTTSIEKGKRYYSPWDDLFGRNPYYYGRPEARMTSGSGVLISEDGYVVTNNHVIDHGDEVEVVLNDKRAYKAEVIGTDPTTDLALLKIEESELPYIAFTNSDLIKVGEWVLAVGNPFNLTSTVTAGIVSAKGRDINIIENRAAIESFIQTDAAVNPGNSGGALVSTRGELVGINTAISTHTGSYEGYSFAIPSNIVKKVIEDLMEHGAVQRAYIGVTIQDITPQLAEEQGIEDLNGVYVNGTMENGAAEQAGVEEGDVIIAIDGVEVRKSSELQELIGQKRPGDHAKLTINREGKIRYMDVTLRNERGNTAITKRNVEILGAELENISGKDKKRLDISYGVKITKLKSGKLKQIGVPEGFVVTRVNRQRVATTGDITRILEGIEEGGVLIEGLYSSGKPGYFAFGM